MAGFLDLARAAPHRPAFILGNGEFVETYGELERRSRRIAHWLRKRGLEAGDCVAVLLGNVREFFDVLWATQRIGLYATPLNWHSTADELAYIVDHCDAKLLISTLDHAPLAAAALARIGRTDIKLVTLGAGAPDAIDLLAELEQLEEAPLAPQPAGSVMIYSSGTTGRPKGVRRALAGRAIDDEAVERSITLVMRTFGLTGDDRYLCPAPLYHAAPMRSCLAIQMLGGTAVVLPRFDAEETLRVIQDQKVTAAQFVPTHFKRMLDLGEARRGSYDISSLRLAIHAAAPCPPETKRAMISWWGPILLEYYAGTEGGGVMLRSEEWLRRPGSVGKPWSGLSVGVLSSGGVIEIAPRMEGPIYFKNDQPSANFSYYKDDALTAEAYRDGWFTLGDIGYFDEDGFLYLTDRKTNLIISGGVNIYPQEAEDILAAHAKVRDVAVIGVPDDEMGEAVKAVVIAADPAQAGQALADELIAYVRERIASYKCPKSVDFVESLPRTETGKLQKRLVRDRYWEGRGSRLA